MALGDDVVVAEHDCLGQTCCSRGEIEVAWMGEFVSTDITRFGYRFHLDELR